MACKKFITLVVLFILMLLFASSKVESTGVAEASQLGSKSRKLVRGPKPSDAPTPDAAVCRGDHRRGLQSGL